MSGLEVYIFLFLLIFTINVVPAFMPPTWVILAFLYLQYHLLFLPTVILGVIAATCGRIILALIARKWRKRILSEKSLGNYAHLGKYLRKNQKLTIPIVFGYAFSPISSNSLFIMVGLSDLNLGLIACSFFIGRIFTYSFWIATSQQISHRLDSIFLHSFSSLHSIIGALLSLLIIVIIGKIKWIKILKLGPKK